MPGTSESAGIAEGLRADCIYIHFSKMTLKKKKSVTYAVTVCVVGSDWKVVCNLCNRAIFADDNARASRRVT